MDNVDISGGSEVCLNLASSLLDLVLDWKVEVS
jgi:hypothetical protein